MSRPPNAWRKVTAQPGHFTLRVLKAFQRTRGPAALGSARLLHSAVRYLLEDGRPFTVNYEANVTAKGSQQRRFVHHVREHEEAKRKKRNERNVLKHREVASWVAPCACCSSARLRSACSRAATTKAADRLLDSSLRLYPDCWARASW